MNSACPCLQVTPALCEHQVPVCIPYGRLACLATRCGLFESGATAPISRLQRCPARWSSPWCPRRGVVPGYRLEGLTVGRSSSRGSQSWNQMQLTAAFAAGLHGHHRWITWVIDHWLQGDGKSAMCCLGVIARKESARTKNEILRSNLSIRVCAAIKFSKYWCFVMANMSLTLIGWRAALRRFSHCSYTHRDRRSRSNPEASMAPGRGGDLFLQDGAFLVPDLSLSEDLPCKVAMSHQKAAGKCLGPGDLLGFQGLLTVRGPFRWALLGQLPGLPDLRCVQLPAQSLAGCLGGDGKSATPRPCSRLASSAEASSARPLRSSWSWWLCASIPRGGVKG